MENKEEASSQETSQLQKKAGRASLWLGIVGGFWALLAPLVIFVPVYQTASVSPDDGVVQRGWDSLLEAGEAGDALPFLFVISALGLVGLGGIWLERRGFWMGRLLLWTSAIGVLVAAIISVFSVGLFFFPAAIILILAASGLRGKKPPLARECPVPSATDSPDRHSEEGQSPS